MRLSGLYFFSRQMKRISGGLFPGREAVAAIRFCFAGLLRIQMYAWDTNGTHHKYQQYTFCLGQAKFIIFASAIKKTHFVFFTSSDVKKELKKIFDNLFFFICHTYL